MKTNSGTHSRKGFMTRLRHDQSGNVIALLAAAVVPAIGIVGGAVDMSRIFIARTSLQAACDAGSLMGRRVMGNSTWAANGNKANTKAEQLFDSNYRNGYIGTTNRVRTFTENAGTVTGEASVRVPMALMSVFGIEDKLVEVTCEAEMRIPASDIMFVLDTTGSMNCPEDGSSCSGWGGTEAPNAKIKGLRKASSCFYEALAKQNITAYSAADCGETTNPVGATTDVRLRFGFVPYSVNVNVGKLLPLNYVADQWEYQSRQAVIEVAGDPDAYDPTYGTESAYAQSGSPTNNSGTNVSWTDLGQNLLHSNGQTYAYLSQRTSCVTVPNETRSTTGAYTYLSQSPATPAYPDSNITRTYRRIDTSATYSYRYRSYKQGKKDYCQLQYQTTNTQNTTRNFTTTMPITWAFNPAFEYWDYKKMMINVSALKNTANNSWRNSLSLKLGSSGANATINWNGCIEERKTARINDSDPSDNWDPIPTAALDMDIESAPTSDPDTKWGPLLSGAIYTRDVIDGSGNSARTTNGFRTSSNATNVWHSYGGNSYDADTLGESCPTQAKLYAEMDASAFSTYLSSLQTGGNTYHDIGLLWGARLMAPNGIFKSVTSDTNAWVERHMIFMTDGDTQADVTNYSAHGVHWWDRRQNDGSSAPSDAFIEANINARTQALCKWVRNENITLWVVAFGQGLSTDAKTALENCASPGRYFEADDTAGLVAEFKTIANSISALRLTQ